MLVSLALQSAKIQSSRFNRRHQEDGRSNQKTHDPNHQNSIQAERTLTYFYLPTCRTLLIAPGTTSTS